MDKNPILKFIDRLPFFQEFSTDEKSKLVEANGVFEKYKNGKDIIIEGESGSALFIILTGTVRITKSSDTKVLKPHVSLMESNQTILAELKGGAIFGEISLISDGPRNTSAYASSSEVILMRITKKAIESFDLTIQKKFHTQLIKVLIQRLDDMNSKYISLKVNTEK
ncbi:MAG: cyclic nucleotide-binding domain-containing protein [Nitrospinae bacterium]|nr:cyclic nucleotide-binding domain-containing protein [Nitrospinota bacterium]